MRTGFSEKLINVHQRADNGDVDWAKAFKRPPQDRNFFRVLYPNYFDKHFTVFVLDIPPGDAKRSARAVFLDPLQEFRVEVTNTFRSWFKYREFDNVSIINLHGGDQGNNTSECGIFAMLNLDILLATKTFFALGDWKRDSLKRNCDTCIEARSEYAAVLRQHVIEYICAGSPVPLPQLQHRERVLQPQAVNVSAAATAVATASTAFANAQPPSPVRKREAPVAPAAAARGDQLAKRKADAAAAACADQLAKRKADATAAAAAADSSDLCRYLCCSS